MQNILFLIDMNNNFYQIHLFGLLKNFVCTHANARQDKLLK